jgi:hypothetical protein
MDVSRFVLESAAFTRATLAGKWSRWLTIVLLGLPWMLISSLAASGKILDGLTIQWNQVPWNEAGLLAGAALVCNFFISGYVVRLLKGNPVPPEFDNWPQLFLDGVKINVIPLVWILAPSVLAFIEYNIVTGGLLPGNEWGTALGSVLIFVLLVIQLVILFIAVQYGIIGAIRFARMGSVREAFDLKAIMITTTRIGIVNYFIALAIITLIWLGFTTGLHVLSLVPYIGGILSLCLWSPVIVFCVRFMAHLCDEDTSPERGGLGMAGEPLPGRLPARGMIKEILIWLVILAVFVILCFTPLALVVGSVTGFFL